LNEKLQNVLQELKWQRSIIALLQKDKNKIQDLEATTQPEFGCSSVW
jgi:hypothetical protein